MKVEIEHIVTFVTVVEQKSFTAAAIALGVSKSVVSKHISALEDALKNQFLIRTTRQLQVTDAGLAYYQHVKTIPDLVEQAMHMLQSYNDTPQGLLRLLSPANLSNSLKKEVIPTFLLNYPKVKLHLRFARRPEDDLHEKFDIAVLWKLSNENFPNYDLIAKKLISIPIGMYASKNYLKKHGIPQTPDDLAGHNCFSSGGLRWPFREENGEVYFRIVEGNLDTNDDEIIKTAVMKGLGIAYSHRVLFQDELNSREVVPVLQNYSQLFIDVCAFYQPTTFVPLKISKFIDAMQTYYHQIQNELK